MLKILFSPKEAKKRPLAMMLIGIFYSSISILLSVHIFPGYSSLVMVFLTLLSCIYVVQGAIRFEESKEKDYKSERWVLEEHFKILKLFFFLFLGFVISFAFWTTVLSSERVFVLFELQSSVVDGIRAVGVTGNSFFEGNFFTILFNNFKVLLIALILAFFYGAGAIFVIAWNASVMGFVIGNLAKNTLGLVALPIAFTKYFLHGIPEMLAYLVIALAGGLIYASFIKGDFTKPGRNKRLIIDVCVLCFISILLLILGALIEVFVSPYV